MLFRSRPCRRCVAAAAPRASLTLLVADGKSPNGSRRPHPSQNRRRRMRHYCKKRRRHQQNAAPAKLNTKTRKTDPSRRRGPRSSVARRRGPQKHYSSCCFAYHQQKDETVKVEKSTINRRVNFHGLRLVGMNSHTQAEASGAGPLKRMGDEMTWRRPAQSLMLSSCL